MVLYILYVDDGVRADSKTSRKNDVTFEQPVSHTLRELFRVDIENEKISS